MKIFRSGLINRNSIICRSLIKSAKYAAYAMSAFVGMVLLYLLMTIILSIIPVNTNQQSPQKGVEIYLLTNGVHSDIAVPIKNSLHDWSGLIKNSNADDNDTLMKIIAFGWGEKAFYLETPEWSDLKFTVAFNAVFGLGNPAIHTTIYPELKESDDCKKLAVSNEDFKKLTEYIKKSFKFDSNGNASLLKSPAYPKNEAFYDANGHYSLFYTSNTWVNDALKSCRQKACLWTPFDKGIFYHYR